MRNRVDKVLEYFLVSLMSLLVIDVLWQVTSRYVLASPSTFTDELATFLLIWVGLLGSAYVFGKDEHLAIDLLEQSLTQKNRIRLRILIYTIVFLFAFAVLVVGGSWLVYTRFQLGVTSASLQINLGYVYAVLPLSGVITLYYAVANTIRLILKPSHTAN